MKYLLMLLMFSSNAYGEVYLLPSAGIGLSNSLSKSPLYAFIGPSFLFSWKTPGGSRNLVGASLHQTWRGNYTGFTQEITIHNQAIGSSVFRHRDHRHLDYRELYIDIKPSSYRPPYSANPVDLFRIRMGMSERLNINQIDTPIPSEDFTVFGGLTFRFM